MDSHWPDWSTKANCLTVGTEGFYPSGWSDDWHTPLRVCDRCSVVPECREWVMEIERGTDYRQRFGIVAGMTPLSRFKYEPQWLVEQVEGAA